MFHRRRKPSTKKQERTFDRQEENRCGDVDAELYPEKRGHRREIDGVSCAELFHTVDSNFLNQVGAVGDAGDGRGTGDCDSIKWKSRTDHTNKHSGHPDSNEWELPATRSNCEIFGFAEIQCVND